MIEINTTYAVKKQKNFIVSFGNDPNGISIRLCE
jgi:hypothetical protein